MMETYVYGRPIKETQDILLASAIYSEVIEGLNEYFESEGANDYITICSQINSRTYVLYDPEKWADILIAWLRTKHGIFYYHGMEAKYAKMEKITPFTKRMMNEGALNSLKKLYKNITGEEDETSSPTLIASTISCNFSNKDKMISVLKEQNELLKDEIRNLNAELATKWTKTSLINWLQQGARHKGVELDDAFLYSDDVQYDWTDIVNFLFDEIVKMKQEIKETRKKHWNDLRDIYKELGCDGVYGNVDDFAKAVKARAEYVESLSRNAEWKTRNAVNEQLKKDTHYVADVLSTILEALGISKSDTVHLDVFGLKTKAIQRASVIKSEHDRYLEQLNKAAADYQALDKEYQELKSSQKSDTNKLIRDCCANHGIIAPSRYLSDEASVEYVFSLLDSYSKQRNEACADRDRAVAILQNLYRDIFKKQPDGLSAEDIANKVLDRVLETEDLDIREKTRNEVFYYIIGTYQKHGLDPSDIYSPNNSLEDVIYRLIVRYEAKVKLCNQLKQEGVDRNDVIKRLKELLNEINKEEENEWFKP